LSEGKDGGLYSKEVRGFFLAKCPKFEDFFSKCMGNARSGIPRKFDDFVAKWPKFEDFFAK